MLASDDGSGADLDSLPCFAPTPDAALSLAEAIDAAQQPAPSAAVVAAAEGGESGAAASEPPMPGARRAVRLGQKYWAQRAFRFLSKVRELKAVPKNERQLHDPAILQHWP